VSATSNGAQEVLQACVEHGELSGRRRGQDGNEGGGAGAVVEQALSLKEGCQLDGRTAATNKCNNRDRVGGTEDGTQQQCSRPAQSDYQVNQEADHTDRDHDACGREQCNWPDHLPKSSEVEVERSLEDEGRDEDRQDELRAETQVRQPGHKPNHNAKQRQDDLIWRQPAWQP
jgi:hypothetical protein